MPGTLLKKCCTIVSLNRRNRIVPLPAVFSNVILNEKCPKIEFLRPATKILSIECYNAPYTLLTD